jgi:hypothetical protein
MEAAAYRPVGLGEREVVPGPERRNTRRRPRPRGRRAGKHPPRGEGRLRGDRRARQVRPAEVPRNEDKGDHRHLDGYRPGPGERRPGPWERDRRDGPESEAESPRHARRGKRDELRDDRRGARGGTLPEKAVEEVGAEFPPPENVREGIRGGRKRSGRKPGEPESPGRYGWAGRPPAEGRPPSGPCRIGGRRASSSVLQRGGVLQHPQ